MEDFAGASANAGPIRVLIADDHPLYRHALMDYLGGYEDIRLVGEATNGREAIEICEQLQPDVVLMDLVMPVETGITAMQVIQAHFPAIQLVALTGVADAQTVRSALQAGASGYLLKTSDVDAVVQAIRMVRAGKLALAPEAVKVLMDAVIQPPPVLPTFTHRERQVLELLVQGETNSAIGGKLGIQTDTVKTHVSNILSKFGVRSRGEAIRLALQLELVQQDWPHVASEDCQPPEEKS
jgi:DNA-binding NarL/FixJ family response regulator